VVSLFGMGFSMTLSGFREISFIMPVHPNTVVELAVARSDYKQNLPAVVNCEKSPLLQTILAWVLRCGRLMGIFEQLCATRHPC